MNNSSKPWPVFANYPQTEVGWNRYANEWVARKRMTSTLADIPKSALEEHWAAMNFGRDKGWEEQE